MEEQSTTSSTRLAVNQPTRGADHNRYLPADATENAEPSLLPSLEDGITLLDIDGSRGVRVLQSLALDHLLMNEGHAVWVDSQGYATTTSLARIAPSQRLLDRVHVARGFTAYQHYAAVSHLPDALQRHHRPDSAEQPSLIVAPAVDGQYRGTDSLHDEHARTLQARVLARLSGYAREYDAPVLVTRTRRDDFTTPIENAADHHLECEYTQLGPRFVGSEFETTVYPAGDGYYQTTFAFWKHILGARASQVGLQPGSSTTPETPAGDVGRGIMADGSTSSLTADPMLDAWTSAGGGGR